jgi:hypothetical protein
VPVDALRMIPPGPHVSDAAAAVSSNGSHYTKRLLVWFRLNLFAPTQVRIREVSFALFPC